MGGIAYTTRILNKIGMNKISSEKSIKKNYKLEEIELKINYRKLTKEIYQIYELMSIIEQMSGEKPLLKLNESKEGNNKVRLDDGQIKVRIRGKKARMFISNFKWIELGERKYYNIKEKNNVNIIEKRITYRFKDLKFFRKLLMRSFMNIEARIKVEIKYKTAGISKEEAKVRDYAFYLEKKNEYKIKK